MASRTPGKVCSVCHSGYRGSYAVHMTTAKHRLKAHQRSDAGKSITKTGGGSGAARMHRGALAARRSRENHDRATLVRIRKYRRSLPDDGAAKVVPVDRHWRHRPAVFAELRTHAGRLFRVTYAAGTGKLLSTRYASGADRRRWAGASEAAKKAGRLYLGRGG